MGTHCNIGIEDRKDGKVRYIYVHYDGYFSNIVPILRARFMKRSEVEKLVRGGDLSGLSMHWQPPSEPSENSEPSETDWSSETSESDWSSETSETSETSEPSEECPYRTIEDRYKFEERCSFIHYFYLFNKEDKWECQSTSMFQIDELK